MYHHPPPHAQRNAQARLRNCYKRRRYNSDAAVNAAQVNKRFKPLVDSHHTTHHPPTPPYPHDAERNAQARLRNCYKRKRYESDTELNTRIHRKRIKPLVDSHHTTHQAEYDPFDPHIDPRNPWNQWMRATIRNRSHECVQRHDDDGLLARITAYRQSGCVDRAGFVQAERTAAFLRNTARGPLGALPVA